MDTLEQADRDRLVKTILGRRRSAAYSLGVEDDLRSVVLLAVVEAEQSWDPEAGRTLFAWTWANAEWASANFLRSAAYQAAHTGEEVDTGYDPTTTILVRNALDYLRARLSSTDWQLLWLARAEGYRPQDLARQAGVLPNSVSHKLWLIENKATKILRRGGIVGVHG